MPLEKQHSKWRYKVEYLSNIEVKLGLIFAYYMSMMLCM